MTAALKCRCGGAHIPPLSVVSRPPAATPPRPAGDPFLLVAEQALSDELGVLDVLAHASVHPIRAASACSVSAFCLQVVGDGVDPARLRNAVLTFAWGYLKAELRNRPRALNSMARALAAGIEDAKTQAVRLADDDADAFDRAFV